MDVIIPCAGQSSRFPNMRPKYLLSDYLGRSMIEMAAEPYLGKHRVHTVILREHEDQHGVIEQLAGMFGDAVNVVVLPRLTSGPAETVSQALDALGLGDSPFLVRDCDSIIAHGELMGGNRLFVDDLANHPTLRAPANKSYVEVNNLGVVTNIVEKKIISQRFCVGGYQFGSALRYQEAFAALRRGHVGEIYISTVIDHMIGKGEIFTTIDVKAFNDLGTAEDWQRHNDKPTLFVDIDGTLVMNQTLHGRNGYGTAPVPLERNVAALRSALDRGCQIVFTTARPQSAFHATRSLLDGLGFGDCQMIMGLHHARRILINDHAPTNPYPSAVAINIKRNDDSLDQILR